ncbi:hypothetical protein [Joostella sp. CR20]|uniref:hypothetical protein n=1 Tax=Joostella sp. CR20 TaxID=2804312 RepID=UPI00313D7B11
MKRFLGMFIYIGLTTSTFAQLQYSQYFIDIEPITNQTIYKNIPNTIAIEPNQDLEFPIDSIKVECEGGIASTISSGLLTLTPNPNSSYCQLKFFFGEKQVGYKILFPKRLPEPFFYSYQLNDKDESSFYGLTLGSQVGIDEIKRIKEFELLTDLGTGKNGHMFVLNSFDYKILRDDKIVINGTNTTGILSKETIADFEKLKVGDFLILYNVNCNLKNGFDKRIFNYRVVKITNAS